jgi:Holliday junction DNA helicase RuvB
MVATGNIDTLRPSSLDEFVGQEKLKTRLTVHIDAALRENRPLGHVLLVGRPGFGKTALASLIAGLMDEELEVATMPLSENALTGIVRRHQGVLFLDEIHRATAKQMEMLLTLLEFGFVQSNRGAKTHNFWLTVVGATTEPQKLLPTVVQRFPIKAPRFEEYTDDELARIVMGMAAKADVPLGPDACVVLGRAAGGAPRCARDFVLAAHDLWVGTDKTQLPTAQEVLDFCTVGEDGLNDAHLAYLRALDLLGRRSARLRCWQSKAPASPLALKMVMPRANAA